MRKPVFCICENKDADWLRGSREADQRLCFRYTDTTISLLSKSEIFKLLAIFCGCTARFVWDLVGNPEDRFSHNEAKIKGDLKFEDTVDFVTWVNCSVFIKTRVFDKTSRAQAMFVQWMSALFTNLSIM